MGRRFLLIASVAFLFVGAAGAARVTGTQRADVLLGGVRSDVINARGGNDRVKTDGGRIDRISCGRGRDLVNADLRDRVARDCEVVARVIARDPYGGPAQHSTIAEPDTFAHGPTIVAAFQVGRFRDGGAFDIGWATSRDEGRTWRSGRLPFLTRASEQLGRWARASDPVVAYDAVHGVWLIASLALTPGEASAVVVSRSTNGVSWSAPIVVTEARWRDNTLLDKEWIVCDNGAASPHRGSCYVTYSDFRTLRLEFQASRDGGLTWGAPVATPENAGRRSIVGRWAPAPQPVVQPDGDLIVPYYDEDRVAAVRSADGGTSFSRPVPVAPTRFKATPGLRAPPLPSADVGGDGTVYVVWPDCSAACERDDLVIASSADGIAWTRLRRIPLGRVGDHVIPGVAADPVRPRRLALAYYTSKPGDALDVGFVTSADGGRRWSAPRRLSAQTMRLGWIAQARGAMVGDYISTSFVGRNAVAVFPLASRPRARLDQPLFAVALRP